MTPHYRSAAVARMLRMPVATLRVWERRYALSGAERSASGQRLYSSVEVQRLALIKQLCDLGHAIGQLAPLSHDELHAVASTHAGALAQRVKPGQAVAAMAPAASHSGWALAGPDAAALLARLKRPALRQLLAGRDLPDLWQPETGPSEASEPLDLLLHHYTELPQLEALPLHAARRHALLYRFGSSNTAQRLLGAGVLLLGEPQPDAALTSWLHLLLQTPLPAQRGAEQAAGHAPGYLASGSAATAIPPRRWDDASLIDFAGLSTTVACECPRHLADLLLQLTAFERYTASCLAQSANSPAERALHAELARITATARNLFEQGLEQVARHEGLIKA